MLLPCPRLDVGEMRRIAALAGLVGRTSEDRTYPTLPTALSAFHHRSDPGG
jgi:hypothetical protein